MSRFAVISQEKREQLIADKDAKNTKRATKVAWNALQSWLQARKKAMDPATISKEDLDQLLAQFFLEARQQNGELYKVSAFRGIRSGIARKFKQLRQFDIINDPVFGSSKTSYLAQNVDMKKQGMGKIKHKEAITETDLARLQSSGVLSTDTPKSLLRKVFFDLEYYFCRRAMENLRLHTKTTFVVKVNEHGVEYVEIDIDEWEKNHGLFGSEYEGGRMYADGTDKCPVASFKKYISLLHPGHKALFQRPKPQTPKAGPWFDCQVIGEKSLEKMMKTIGQEAGLSQPYTNHCIRATCITTLDDEGFSERHICSVSGHTNPKSIQAYSRTGEKIRRKMYDTLSKKLNPERNIPTQTKVEASSTFTSAEIPPLPNVATVARQEELRAVSSVPTFDFAISSAFHDIDDESMALEINQLENNSAAVSSSSSNPILCNSTLLNQLSTSFSSPVPGNSTTSRPCIYFSAGSNPVFINCSFS